MPIVILSAASAAELGWAAETSKQDLWLRKPFKPRELVQDILRIAQQDKRSAARARTRARARARPLSLPALHFPPMTLFDSLGPAVAAELSSMRDAVPRHLLLGNDAEHAIRTRAARRMRGAAAPRGGRAVRCAHARGRGRGVRRALRDAGFAVHELLVADGPHGDPVCDDVTKRRARCAAARDRRDRRASAAG